VLERGGWSAPRPGRFTPGKELVPIVQEAGWAPGPVWTGAENLTPTGIRFANRPARSQSLYRLSYVTNHSKVKFNLKSRRIFSSRRIQKYHYLYALGICVTYPLPITINLRFLILTCFMLDIPNSLF
jgi:hypothetical protein